MLVYNWMMATDGRTGFGVAVGAIGAILAAAGLVAVRGSLAAVNVMLVLVLFVLVGAVIGGRVAGVVSALTATAAFDFFHTQPYNSLKIDNVADLETCLLLLVVGIAIGELAVRVDRSREAGRGNRGELLRVHRVARLAADGESVDDLISAITAELTSMLGLHGCLFERPPFVGRYATLHQSGAITGPNTRQYTKRGFGLPRDGVELPIVVGDDTVARFVLLPSPGLGVSVDRRMVAVTIAGQLGVVLGRVA